MCMLLFQIQQEVIVLSVWELLSKIEIVLQGSN